jgi:hypothetical protein
MPAICADQRLSQAVTRRNHHVLFRIAQSRALSMGLVSIVVRRSLNDFHSDYRWTSGCKQRFRNAVNDRLGIEPELPAW